MLKIDFFKLLIKHFELQLLDEVKSEKNIYSRYQLTIGQMIHISSLPEQSYFNEFFFSENVLLPQFVEFEDTFEFIKALHLQQGKVFK